MVRPTRLTQSNALKGDPMSEADLSVPALIARKKRDYTPEEWAGFECGELEWSRRPDADNNQCTANATCFVMYHGPVCDFHAYVATHPDEIAEQDRLAEDSYEAEKYFR
jgi:hypothetical protein